MVASRRRRVGAAQGEDVFLHLPRYARTESLDLCHDGSERLAGNLRTASGPVLQPRTSFGTCWIPCATMMPNSAIWARRPLTSIVRCRTSNRAPVQHPHALLLNPLYRHKAHLRPRHGLADRFGAGRVVLAAIHVSLEVLGGTRRT
jgi:hypothetical protein